MDESLSKAFMVLIVGMLTVFVILSLVVLTGKVLILLVNKFAPLPIERNKHIAPIRTATNTSKISKKKLAAIVATVEAISGSNARITSIEKINTIK